MSATTSIPLPVIIFGAVALITGIAITISLYSSNSDEG